MMHLKRLSIGFVIIGLELGLVWTVLKTHYGPYIFFGIMIIFGAYAMGWAVGS